MIGVELRPEIVLDETGQLPADQGDADREDNGCGILYGVLRDSAYKLKKLAEEEKQNHIIKGWWQERT